MISSTQKSILLTLFELHWKSDHQPIKGEEIASVMKRKPGTIRNQMQYLRSIGIVKGFPGPKGGYSPTLKAYHALDLDLKDIEGSMPLFKKGKRVTNSTAAKIEFRSIPHPEVCEAAVKVIGDIKTFNYEDKIRIGPSPVNKLVLNGTVTGRDDSEGVLLMNIQDIRSIPHKPIMNIATDIKISLEPEMRVNEAAWILANNGLGGAPVMEGNEVVGILTLLDIAKAIANEDKDLKICKLMSKYIITIDQNMMISESIQTMNKYKIGRLIVTDELKNPIGIVTKSDILNEIAGLEYLTYK